MNTLSDELSSLPPSAGDQSDSDSVVSFSFFCISVLLVFSLLSGSLVVCSFVFSWLNFLPSLPAVRRDPPLYGRSLTTCLFMSLSVCTLTSSRLHRMSSLKLSTFLVSVQQHSLITVMNDNLSTLNDVNL